MGFCTSLGEGCRRAVEWGRSEVFYGSGVHGVVGVSEVVGRYLQEGIVSRSSSNSALAKLGPTSVNLDLGFGICIFIIWFDVLLFEL